MFDGSSTPTSSGSQASVNSVGGSHGGACSGSSCERIDDPEKVGSVQGCARTGDAGVDAAARECGRTHRENLAAVRVRG